MVFYVPSAEFHLPFFLFLHSNLLAFADGSYMVVVGSWLVSQLKSRKILSVIIFSFHSFMLLQVSLMHSILYIKVSLYMKSYSLNKEVPP